MKRYKQSEIEEVSTILKNDGVISIPTDTVYGYVRGLILVRLIRIL